MSRIDTSSPHIHARRAGLTAVTGGALLFIGVVTPLVITVQAPDGRVLNAPLYALSLTAFTAGAILLAASLLSLKTAHDASGDHLPRSGRIGTRVSVAGAALLAIFGVVHLTTTLTTGTPAEASFLLFGLGALALIAGHVALSLGLRRTGVLRAWWVAPLTAAAALLLAIAVPADLWHHLGLFTFDAAWVAFGAHLVARSRAATAPPRVEPSPL